MTLTPRRTAHDPTNRDSILRAVRDTYVAHPDEPLDNQALYRGVMARTGLTAEQFAHAVPVGKSGSRRSVLARATRWSQQSLRLAGVLERVPRLRGVWRLTHEAKTTLHMIQPGNVIVGFSTRLGVALWADCRSAGSVLTEHVDLVLASPMYPIEAGRAYGRIGIHEYVDTICELLEPVVQRLAPTGSLALNLSNDIYVRHSPARTLYREHLAIALHERLGLHRMDDLIWASNKPTGPTYWACRQRVQLAQSYEWVMWYARDPLRVKADNRRVLRAHSKRHLKLIASGGEQRHDSSNDGAYRKRPGGYSSATPGRIARNILDISNNCAGQRQYKRNARALGLPAHPAAFPEALARFLSLFLTEPGDLCVDICSGSQTMPRVCETLERRWLSFETAAEFIRGGATRFEATGLWINPDLDQLLNLDALDQQSLDLRLSAPASWTRRRAA